MEKFKSGFVSIIGRPNVGKSTLLNNIIGEKVAIISNKPQTTRNRIQAILTDDNFQMIFLDTPGIHRPRNKLGDYMVKASFECMNGIDVILLVVEPCNPGEIEIDIIEKLKTLNTPVMLIINKVDTVKKETLFEVVNSYNDLFSFNQIIPVSALKGDGVDIIIKESEKHLPEGPKFYPDEMFTDQPERQVAAEIIREKALRLLDKEVPHGIAVEILEMKEKKNITIIRANINCERVGHKGIIIGRDGEMLKKISSYAREDIEKMLGVKVFLEIWVKVKEGWRNSNYLLNDFGYKNK